MQIQLETQRLILRELNYQDSEILRENMNNSEIVDWLEDVPHPFTGKDSIEWIDYCNKKSKKTFRTIYIAGIELKKNERFIGEIGLNPLHLLSRRGELVYWVDKSYQGNGFASEALEEFTNFAFNKIKINTLEASIFLGNIASENLIKKLGFHLTKENKKEKEYILSINDYINF